VRRGRGLVGTALAGAQAWLIEPVEDVPAVFVPGPSADTEPAEVVAVYGLSPGCGASMVARGLGAELAARHPSGAAAVTCESVPGGVSISTSAAARLARGLAGLPAEAARPAGRLCLVAGADPLALADLAAGLAPVVLDAGSSALGGREAAVAGRVVLVAPSGAEPSLAEVATACLARVGSRPLLVVSGRGTGWEERASVLLPRSRVAARLALAGREPPGDAGRAIARLADLVGEEARTRWNG
jgi:hypothetical protein